MWAVAFLIGLAALTACRAEGPPAATATPIPPTPTPDPRALLRDAAEAMQALDSTHFLIARTGGPSYLDVDQTMILNSAEGDYASPDAIQATVQVQLPGLNMDLTTIAIGSEQWISNPLTLAWEQLPPGWGFNPAVLFDPVDGWRRILDEDVVAISPIESIEREGEALDHVRATIIGDRIRLVTGGLVRDAELDVAIWLTPETHTIRALHFVTNLTAPEPTDWVLEFSAYNQGPAIGAPE